MSEKKIESDEQIILKLIKNERVTHLKKILSDKTLKEIWKYRFKNNNNENETVLHISVNINNTEIIYDIIKYCKENMNKEDFKEFINIKNSKGTNALHYASFKGNLKIIKTLIDNGADIECKTEKGLGVYHYASQGNQPNSIVYFNIYYKDRIKIHEPDFSGSTPLNWACYTSALDAALYLLNYKADINSKDNEGNTPLHLAVKTHSAKLVLILLQRGADISVRNKKGFTPKDLAFKKESCNDIYELLRNSEKCQLFNTGAPLRKIEKSRKNIFVIIIFQLISFFILMCFIFPSMIQYYVENEENKDFLLREIIYSFFFWGYLQFTILFIVLHVTLIFLAPDLIPIQKEEDIKKMIDNDEELNLAEYCPKCLVKKTVTSKHCVICDRCCNEFDHHCYWVNNCISKKNYVLFMVFLFFSFIHLCFVFSICIYSFFCSDLIEKEEKQIKECILDKLISLYKFQQIPECFAIIDKKYSQLINLIPKIILSFICLFFLIPQFFLVKLHLQLLFCEKRFNKKKYQANGLINNLDETYTEDLVSQDDSLTEYSASIVSHKKIDK